MYKNLVIIVVTFMAVFSCKKEENKTSVYTNYISSSMKPYMFKANSYWVYENDSTHVLDSIFVTNVHQGFFNEPPTAPSRTTRNKNEYYKMTLHENLSSKI